LKKIKINIINKIKSRKIYLNKIKTCVEYVVQKEIKNPNKTFKKFLKFGDKETISLNIILIDDKAIKKYNKKYFGKLETTDVISFSMIENGIIPGSSMMGDIIISLDTIKKNANLFNNTYQDELLLVVIHGVLHLMGYDHLTEDSIMRKKERKYLDNCKKYVL